MKAFAIFGGFNPVTNRDVELGKFLLEKFSGSFILYMVELEEHLTKLRGLNISQVLPLDVRIQLLTDALPKIDNINIVTQPWFQLFYNVDVLRNSVGLTFDLYLVIDEDKVSEFYIWQNWQHIVAENKFLVLTKDKENVQLPEEVKQFANNFEFLEWNNGPDSVSSTEIREAYCNNNLNSVKCSLPNNVYEYLTEAKGLYGKETEQEV